MKKHPKPGQDAQKNEKDQPKPDGQSEEAKRRRIENPQDLKKPKNDEKAKNEKKETAKRPPDDKAELDPRSRQNGRWGDLPAKLHGEAEKARQEKVPEKFRDDIERYRKSITD